LSVLLALCVIYSTSNTSIRNYVLHCHVDPVGCNPMCTDRAECKQVGAINQCVCEVPGYELDDGVRCIGKF